ncbi:tyrosine-type recombinase/integrase [soil metagenome]
MPRNVRQPSYRLHKPRNSAVVTINGKNHYLGPWQSPESHEKYAALVAEWKRNGGSSPTQTTPTNASTTTPESTQTVSMLILAYFKHAQTYYVKHSKPTSEQDCLKQALRPLRQLYGSTAAVDFGPRSLKNVRQTMVDAGRARKSINKDIHRIRRMFCWAVEEELLAPEVYQKLKCVTALARGKTTARETKRIPPIPLKSIEAILPHLPPPVAAMVRLQLLIGGRPQDVMNLRPCDLVKGDGVWYYTPSTHKTEHLDREKCIVLGPKAMEVLQPFLDREVTAYCFNPAESVAWRHARCRKHPENVNPDAKAPQEYVNPAYTRHSYRVAVQRACRRAKVPVWSPRQLRHTRASEIRQTFGTIEAAKAVLGHTDSRVTEYYAERDLILAADVMRQIG